MSVSRLSCSILTAIFVSVILTYATPAQNLDEIIRIADIGDNLLKSGMGTMVYETTHNTESRFYTSMMNLRSEFTGGNREFSWNLSGEYEFAFEDGRYAHIYRQLEDTFSEELRVFNGRTLKSLTTRINPAFQQIGNIDYPSLEEGHIGEVADPRYHTTIFGEPVAAFLRRNAALIGEVTIDGMVCLEFSGTRVGHDSPVTAFLAPADLYHRPVRIEQSSNRNKATWDIEYTVENGIVAPVKIITQHYEAIDDGVWNPSSTIVIEMVGEPQFNIDVPDSLFDLVFPPGAYREPRMEPIYDVPTREF